MPATMEERLDELLGMAKELGTAETELAKYEHDQDTHSAHTLAGRNARRWLPSAREHAKWCTYRLENARARFMSDLSKAGLQ